MCSESLCKFVKMKNFMISMLFMTLTIACTSAEKVPKKIDTLEIIPSNEEIEVRAGNNYNLTCKGKRPLKWIFPEDNLMDDESENVQKFVRISKPTKYSETHEILLEMRNLSVLDVGSYYCAYNNSEYEYEEAVLEAKGLAKSIYLYVQHPDKLLVQLDPFLDAKLNRPLTIPCKPTSTNVEVKLFRKENEKYVEIKPNKLRTNERFVKYEKRSGFTISKIEMSDEDLLCTGSRDGKNDDKKYTLSITTPIESIPKPYINDSSNGKLIVGGVIKLNCTFILDSNDAFEIEWLYNNKNLNKNDKRINIFKTYPDMVIDGNRQKVENSILTVENVIEKDSGNYTCRVSVLNDDVTNNITQEMRVLRSSYIHLLAVSNKTEYESKTGELLDIIINIDSFLKPVITWYDTRNKEIFPSSKYDIKISNNETHLQIKNVTIEDRGVYRVKGQSGNVTDALSITLRVFSRPEIKLTTDLYLIRGIKYNITCDVLGYPVPSIEWYLKECEGKNCSSTVEEKKEFDNISLDKDNSTVHGTTEIIIWKSSCLVCDADNEFQNSSNSILIYATEEENGFNVINSRSSIVEGDNVTLNCSVSKYKYPDETINWYKLPGKYPIKEEQNFDHDYYRYSTNYSNKFILSFKNISMTNSGDYECRVGQNYPENKILDKQLVTLNVTAKAIPVISDSDTNLNETRIQLGVHTMNVKFHCKAKGNPKPQISWFKDDKQINRSARINISEDTTYLIFTYMAEEDDGKYSCVAKNRVGQTERFIEISINSGDFKIVSFAIIVILLILFIALISILFYKMKKEKELQKQLTLMGLRNFDEGEISGLNPKLGLNEQADLLPYDKMWEFPKEKLKLGKQLGSGAFGVVMKAVAYGILDEEESTTVAVKMVKRTADSALIKALASELKIMIHLGKHLNVVNLLGACTKNVVKRELYVIVEYCRFGNLHNYLLRHREHFIDQIDHRTGNIDPNIEINVINRTYSVNSRNSSSLNSVMQAFCKNKSSVSGDDYNTNSLPLDTANTVVSMIPIGDDTPVTSSGSTQPEWRINYKGDYHYSNDIRPISTQDLLSWSFQIAKGMEYLTNRKVLHGDLAARNILLADNNIVKICDFGLAKNMYKDDNYKKKGDSPLPIKWMAIESIRDRIFSTQSDIWSYGVVLWELFSLAGTPYPGMQADENFYYKIVEGYRMEKPKYSNKIIYDIMLECWQTKPIKRPTFTILAEKLGILLVDDVRQHYTNLNDPYMDMNSKWLAEKGGNDYLAMMNAPDYKNLTSANPTNEYINDPLGCSIKIDPLSPYDADEEYLQMTPLRNNSTNIESHIINLPSPTSPKIIKLYMRENSKNNDKNHEWIPMLMVENEVKRPRSVSDSGESLPTSPNQDKSGITQSFFNPIYQTHLKSRKNSSDSKILFVGNDNYIDETNKDSGLHKNTINSSNNPFASSSYVLMNSNNSEQFSNLYSNIPSNIMT